MILLDSSFLIAYHHARDVHHKSALLLMDRMLTGEWGNAFLLEYVFLEVVNVLLHKSDLVTAQRVAKALLETRDIELLPCSEIFLETFTLFQQQQETKLSFVDMALIAAAHKYKTSNIATFDKGFRQISGLRVYPE